MGSYDVAFVPCRASFLTTFHKNCGRNESLGTTICPKTVAGCKPRDHHMS